MQLSLDGKRRSHKRNRYSSSNSDSLIFTKSYRSTLLITTPTPSRVKTNLKMFYHGVTETSSRSTVNIILLLKSLVSKHSIINPHLSLFWILKYFKWDISIFYTLEKSYEHNNKELYNRLAKAQVAENQIRNQINFFVWYLNAFCLEATYLPLTWWAEWEIIYFLLDSFVYTFETFLVSYVITSHVMWNGEQTE